MATRRQTLPPEFSAWIAIRSRDPNEVWCSFVEFYLDVGKRPTWRHLVIRTDPAGEFSPDNCRMAGCEMVSAATTDRGDTLMRLTAWSPAVDFQRAQHSRPLGTGILGGRARADPLGEPLLVVGTTNRVRHA
jgi:hypothetical protein